MPATLAGVVLAISGGVGHLGPGAARIAPRGRPMRAGTCAVASVSELVENTHGTLSSFLVGNGGDMGPIRLSRAGRQLSLGLCAAEGADEGAVLATVPRKCALSVDDDAMHSLGVEDILGVPSRDTWPVALGARILVEAFSEDSKWKDYLALLPGAFFHLPLYYTDVQFRALKNEALWRRVTDQEDAIDRLSEAWATMGAPFGEACPTASDLKWATAVASSRAIVTDPVTGLALRAVYPVVDFCNHSPSPSCDLRVDQKTGDVSLVARTQLDEGAALTVDYGRVGNDERILRFGFVLPDDPHDFVELPFDGESLDSAHHLGEPEPLTSALHLGALPIDAVAKFSMPDVNDPEALQPFQVSLLDELNLCSPQAAVRFYRDGFDGRLLAALRVLYASEEDVLMVRLTGPGSREECARARSNFFGAPSNQGHDAAALQTSERLLGDDLEERVRQTVVGWSMLAAGQAADPALTAGMGGGIGKSDSHMLVAGRAVTNGSADANTRKAYELRTARMRTATEALRFAKSKLMHALPIQSAFGDGDIPESDLHLMDGLDGLGFPEGDMLGELGPVDPSEENVAKLEEPEAEEG